MIGRKFALAVVAVTLALATSAYAKHNGPPPPPPGPTLGATLCSMSDISVGGSTPTGLCAGWFSGNLNGGSDAMNTDSAIALNQMLGVTTYTAASFDTLHNFAVSGPTVDFGTALYGETIVSFHVGGAKGSKNIPAVGYESTAFFEFNAGDLVGGLETITFNLAGLSNAELISTGSYVPPPPPPCTENCGPPPCTLDCGPPPCLENCGPPPCTGACGGGQVPGVPEPAAWALMIVGFGGAGAMVRRRRAVAS